MALPVRRQYKGAAASTTTTLNIGVADTSVSIASNTGWPVGADPFYVVLSPGTSSEEKCLATISGTSLTLTRAQDDTSAQTHASGTTIYPVFTAVDANQANELASKMTTKGDLLTTNGTDINRLGVGTNTHVLQADSTATNGVKWGQVATAGIADAAITTAKIATGAVVADDLATDSVITVKIQDSAVTTAKIANGAVTAAKLDAGAAVQPTIVDAKGDLIAGTAADTVARLAVGTDGQVLTAASGEATGLKWAGSGKVLQVVQTVVTAASASTTSTSLADISGMSVSITPSATSSKVLVFAYVHIDGTNAAGFTMQLIRGSTAISQGDAASNRSRGSAGGINFAEALKPSIVIHLDSPSTTSSTTYKLQWRTSTGTLYLNRTNTDTDSATYPRVTSSITVVELAP